MRKEDSDRRSAELKARMLAERNADVQRKSGGPSTRESGSSSKQAGKVKNTHGKIESTEVAEVAALKKWIAQLEAENQILRRQLASTNYQAPSPSRSDDDAVREQRHNFFKYSNLRRY